MPATKKPKADPYTWGRLSESLTGPKHPHRCQRCGRHKSEIEAIGAHLQTWLECDANDKPEDIVVMLCTLCNKEADTSTGKRWGMVYRYPRFYKDLEQNYPYPGTLDLCVHCSWRDRTRGTFCAHPDTKANGGLGLRIEYRASAPTFISCRPRSQSVCLQTFQQATSCSRREEEDVVWDLLYAEGNGLSTIMNERCPALTEEQKREMMDFE